MNNGIGILEYFPKSQTVLKFLHDILIKIVTTAVRILLVCISDAYIWCEEELNSLYRSFKS